MPNCNECGSKLIMKGRIKAVCSKCGLKHTLLDTGWASRDDELV